MKKPVLGRNGYETDLTDSKLEYNKDDAIYSEDEVKESFLENINAKVYVEQVDTVGEVQSVIGQHETKCTLKYIQYYGSKDFGNTGTSFGIYLPFGCFQFSMFLIALFPVMKQFYMIL